jgi:hypothetical protein
MPRVFYGITGVLALAALIYSLVQLGVFGR